MPRIGVPPPPSRSDSAPVVGPKMKEHGEFTWGRLGFRVQSQAPLNPKAQNVKAVLSKVLGLGCHSQSLEFRVSSANSRASGPLRHRRLRYSGLEDLGSRDLGIRGFRLVSRQRYV